MDKKVIHTVFEETVKKFPEHIAIEAGPASITYHDLNVFANRIAWLLRSVGCTKGTIINVVAPSSIQLVSALLGVFKSSCVYLPVDLSFAEKRLRQIFSETFDGIVIVSATTHQSFIEMADRLQIKVRYLIVLGDENEISLYSDANKGLENIAFAETNEWTNNLPLEVQGGDSNYIFYTSGSTGEGKAIEGAHAGISHFVHWEIKEFGIDASFRISQLAQVTFDASLRDIFSAMLPGGTLCIPSADIRNHPRKLLEWIVASRVTLVHCVPSLFRVLTKELQLKGNEETCFIHLRYVLMAGELLYAKDILNWRKLAGNGVELVNLYGPTETTLVKTFHRIQQVPENPAAIIHVGVPISNTVIAIVHNNQVCEPGEMGEIYIKTPFMTKGYYKNEALTNECFVQNPLLNDVKDIVYKTGDLGRYLPDGNIEVLGRLDSQVKVNGIRIELGEVERALLGNESITGAVVKTHRTDDNLLTLVAYYTGVKTDPEIFRGKLAKVLNQQMIPSYFIHLDEFPLNINGKVDKKALPLPEDILMGSDNYQAPEGIIEMSLAELWKEILGLKKIGRNISFFSVGGHSLRAIQLVSRIQKEFGLSLKIADIFTNRTIGEQAALIAGSTKDAFESIEPAEQRESYPLSSSQRRSWVLSQLAESNIAYNMPSVYEFDGTLDRFALEHAFQLLIARHESLRTIFKEDESGEIRQFILQPDDLGFRVSYCDLRTDRNANIILKEYINEQCLQAFNLSSGPLLRAGLYQLADDKWVFIYVMHHIISDGWSMRVLFNELLALYDQKNISLSPLRIQYKDYAVWQQQRLAGEQVQADKEYWMKQFEGELPVLSLAGDKPRPANRTFNGGLVVRTINASLTEKLKTYCGQQGGTLFMGLLAAVNVLLHRYTGQEDIIVGSPVAGRINTELEKQIGCYLNTLALRVQINGENNYERLFDHIRQLTLLAYEHQAYPFDELVSSLNLPPDTSRNPLFDVVVVLQNTELASAQEHNSGLPVKISSYEASAYRTSKFDLTFNFAESGNALQAGIEYNSDLFNEATIVRMSGHLEQLLNAILAAPSMPVSQLDYLSDAEKDQLLFSFNDTAIDYPRDRTIVELFEQQVQKTPDKIALEFESISLRYAELNERANRLGNYLLQTYSIEPDDLIGIHLERSEWLIIAILGVLKSGGAYVPIDMEYPADRIQYMLEDSGCKLVIDDEELARYRQHADEYAAANFKTERTSNSLAYVMYTSGSTGRPKGVMVEDRSVVRLVKPGSFAGFTGNERLLSTGAFSFDATTFEYWGMLLNGGCLRLCSQEVLLDADLLTEEISKNTIDMMWFTAGWLNQLVDTNIKVFEGLKTILAGGDKLSPVHIALLYKQYPGLKIINGYGPTENTTFSLTYPVVASSVIPIGKPINNSTAYIIDANDQLVPVGVIGEICVGGDGLSRGYLNNDALTAEKFVHNPFTGERMYRTGDLGKWLPDGNIEFAGRKDEQLKIRGYRVEPGEIENALLSHEMVSAAVIARSNLNGEKELVAYIVTPASDVSSDALRTYLSQSLPAYMIPAHFIQLDELPLTPNGKVDRRALPDPEGLNTQTGVKYVAPQNDKQRQLATVFEEVLRRTPIGINDNFFALGGDSIKSIQVVSRLRQRGYSLTIRDVLLCPVVKDLAERMTLSTRLIDQGLVKRTIPLSPIQLVFFENSSTDKHHFNQSVLLYSKEPLQEEGIRKALDKIVLHHDALRMVYRKEAVGWVQENKGSEQGYSFELIEEGDTNFAAHCERIQAGFDLGQGPLFKAALFRGAGGDKLLLVAHHLVIDGVSWRILLEDLSNLYHQYISGKPLSLPLKTDSFAYWQDKLVEYSKSEDLLREASYWSAIEASEATALPIDHPAGTNFIKDASTVSFQLDEAATHRLLTQCHTAYRVDINDILVTALGVAVQKVFAVDRILMRLEGHGRENIIADADITRTIGWFTTAHPVAIDLKYSNDNIRQLIEVKETLHRVPDKGIGYGVLRYLSGKDYKVDPPIVFNYLGDFGYGAGTSDQLFSFSGEYHGSQLSGNMQRDALLDVSGIVVEGKMRLSIAYSVHQYRQATIQQLLEAYKAQLEILVDRLSAEQQIHLSPVDCTYKDLSVEQIEKLNELGLEDVYPLSPLQQGLYYHWLSAPASPVYSQQLSFRLKGMLDIKLLEESYRSLVARHAVLRTFFTRDFGAMPFQVVRREPLIVFAYKDASGDDSFSPEDHKKAEQSKGFDLHTGSQMRLSVIGFGNADHEFVWTFHHILMDGWCASILIKEFFQLYCSMLLNKTTELMSVHPYSDYIKWLNKVNKEASLKYWQKYLSGYDTITGLPGNNAGSKKRYDAQRTTLTLDAGVKAKINMLCAECGATESTFLQALWGVLLGKYNNTNDVVFGTVVSGRPAELKGVEDMIGLFINTIPVRVTAEEDTNVIQLLQNVQQAAIEGTGHHYVQLAEVQATTALGRNLFDHILVFENYPVQEMVEKGFDNTQDENRLSLVSVQVAEQSSYDFYVTVDTGETLNIHFDYNGSVYDEAHISRLKDHFFAIITAALNDPSKTVVQLAYLSEEERHRLLISFNDTKIDYPSGESVLSLFRKQVAAAPDHTAISFGQVHLTYKELDERSGRLAGYLQQNYQLSCGELVGILLDRSDKMIIAIFAALKCGSGYVPIDPSYPRSRQQHILQQTAIKVLLTQTDYLFNLDYYSGNVFAMDIQLDGIDEALKETLVDIDPSDTAYVIYTSGSTGQPKGCVLTHGSLSNYIQWANSCYFKKGEQANFGLFTSLSFDLTVTSIFCTLTQGGCLFIYDQQQELSEVLRHSFSAESGISCIKLTPSHINMLQHLDISGSSMRCAIVGGEELTAEQVSILKRISPSIRVYNEYGPTEATVGCVVKEVEEHTQVLIGKPIANTSIYILDDARQLCAAGVVGEIFIGGDCLAKGYLHRPELTAERFLPDPFRAGGRMYKTGDLGCWLANGELSFLGRRDEQVKIRGYRIELGEIESALQSCREIIAAVVVVKENTNKEKELVAYLVSKETLNVADLRSQLQSVLPAYMIPAQYVLLDELPLTVNGKVDRKRLPEPEGYAMAGAMYASPRNETEEAMVQIWQEVLERERIGINDNFFEVGGNSIRIVRLSNLVSKKLNKDVSVPMLFEHPTIKGLVDHLSEGQAVYEEPDYDHVELMDDLSKFN